VLECGKQIKKNVFIFTLLGNIYLRHLGSTNCSCCIISSENRAIVVPTEPLPMEARGECAYGNLFYFATVLIEFRDPQLMIILSTIFDYFEG